ncbi:MAG: selenium-dependent xanthine dehydrogenase [Bacteriovoracaceae bacterium]|nr:selenium-dependent xanthine dehydrogenase [Bacteriovoracaceae bacterium]
MYFTLNGELIDYSGDSELSLLGYLREKRGIISVKNGCSIDNNCGGSCGACTVMMNDRATLSCTTPMKRVEGKKVVTTDGLEARIQEAFAKAFMIKGGVQCGFCIPGIVMNAVAFLKRNPLPTRDDVKKVLNRNLCRCTGYKKIVDSIIYASQILAGTETLPVSRSSGLVGSSLLKYDGHDTVLGKRPFVCDLKEEGMRHAALKFSDHPRAEVISIDISEAKRVTGVIKVITAKDIPGARTIGLIAKDWPIMIDEGEQTRYVGDVLAGVVALDEATAKKAVSKIKVKYEVLTPLCTVDQAMRKDAPLIHHKSNILSQTKLKRGDLEEAIMNSSFISEGTYYTQRVEHAFLETECCLAISKNVNGEEGLKVYSQGQGAFEDRKQIATLTGLPLEQVNVVQVQNGGGFGGKEDLTVQGHAAVFAFLTKYPVRLHLNRSESMRMHPKRHPMRMKYMVGCDSKGKLTFVQSEIHGDTGAYASVGMKVLERAAGHATGAYHVPTVDINALAVYTNNVPCGAMRGFGVNQTAFAIESCIDDLCEKGGFDRWQFRFDNALDTGSMTATGQVLKGDIGLKETLMAVKSYFYEAPFAGIACGIKNSGIGNGMPDGGQAKIVINSRHKIAIYHGWTEMGQGVHTMAIQTVCQETGLDPALFEVIVDTKQNTVCGMTTSSRGTVMVGNSLIDACKQLKEDLLVNELEDLVGNEYKGEWVCDWTTEPGSTKDSIEAVTHYSYSYATQLVTLNEAGKIDKVYAAHDAGKIMNPTLFTGQIEGSVHMGLGYAISENFPMKDGWPVYSKLSQLGILKAKDTPDVEVIGIEAYDIHGPYGARGVGEVGLVPTAAAVSNALYQFDQVRRYSLPIGIIKKKKGR